jgi:hypothetical protein
MRSKQIQRAGLQPRYLKFDVEEGRGLVALQNIAKKGYRESRRRAAGNFNPLNGSVVADHGLAIGGESHVELEAITTVG